MGVKWEPPKSEYDEVNEKVRNAVKIKDKIPDRTVLKRVYLHLLDSEVARERELRRWKKCPACGTMLCMGDTGDLEKADKERD